MDGRSRHNKSAVLKRFHPFFCVCDPFSSISFAISTMSTNAKANLLFSTGARAHGGADTDGRKSKCHSRENQINSSNWAHGDITLTQIVWICSSHEICYDFIRMIVVVPRSCSSETSCLGWLPAVSSATQTCFRSIVAPSQHRLNYIRFINLASSVSRREPRRIEKKK